jgi:hypothetical protein
MTRVNANDRMSLERAYPPDIFASDAAQNGKTPTEILRGVRVGSAPDQAGFFELERARRHVGEPETSYFLPPAESQEPDRGYARFLADIVTAAGRFGFRKEDSPGRGEGRLRGLRQ